MVKNLPAMPETWVQSWGQEDSPGEENGNPLQYSCLAIPWKEGPGGLQSMGSQRVRYREINTHKYTILGKYILRPE